MSLSMSDPTTAPASILRARRSAKWLVTILTAAVLGAAYGVARAHVQREQLQTRLLAAAPDAVVKDGALLRFAVGQARPLFAAHCASCHGEDMRGNTALGAPDLTDRV